MLVATGCARQGGEDPESGETAPVQRSKWEPGMINIPEGGEAAPGGELVFGGFQEPRTLDPAVTVTAGPTGGIEMGAIYSFLMRWDSETGELVPELAESLEPNEDFTQWTLKLRPDVTFSNGKPFNATAVQWSIDRYMKLPVDEAKMWQENVTDVEQPDEQTLIFNLARTWPTFGYMMTTAPGMIVGEGSDGATPEEFTPIGAGPYVL
ncbi:MAG: ABC transporter substrate-binding protein, partial [Propionibacterium sp.]|nr:ABC transporter substrate-binding protein [Propionibacterium sp.]